jgi:hypothetical protein
MYIDLMPNKGINLTNPLSRQLRQVFRYIWDVRKRQLSRQFRQAGTGHAGYASRSTDGVRGIFENSFFGFMVKTISVESRLHCGSKGVGSLLEVGV